MSDAATRNFKDNVFCLLHRDKNNLLELYNGMNESAYTDVGSLSVVTLPEAICLKYKNDAAFTFNKDLNLYEQQSTDNPNMPLRLLHYVSEEYKNLIPGKLLYREQRITIPTPHFVVFYNGAGPMPERKIYRLSEMFEKGTDSPELELCAVMLNINKGFNRELLSRCRTLREYMVFVNMVREKKKRMSTEEAVRSSVEECIAEGILAEFFVKYKKEVISVGVFEYNEEYHHEAIWEDGWDVGMEKGMEKGQDLFAALTMTLVRENCQEDLVKAVGDKEFRKGLYKKYALIND